MRFKKLELWNITSLRGHHIIDFEALGRGDGLFAITGPTGSGKSSVLSAISFALFNKHYKNLRPPDIVSYGESEAKIILSFAIGTHHYQSHWALRVRSKKGDLLKNIGAAHHQFFSDNDNSGPLSKSSYEIVGMTFEQFNRCVILNQGEFANFLLSPFAERRKILEEIYGGEDLSLINQVLKKKKKELNDSIEILGHSLENALPFPHEIASSKEKMRKKLEDNHKAIKELIVYLTSTQNATKNLLSLMKDKNSSRERNHELRGKSEELVQKKYHFLDDIKKLQQSVTLAQNQKKLIVPHLDEYMKTEINLGNIEVRIKDINTRQINMASKMAQHITQKEDSEKKITQKITQLASETFGTSDTSDIDDGQQLETVLKNIEIHKNALKDQQEICNQMMLILQKQKNCHETNRLRQNELKKCEEKGINLTSQNNTLILRQKEIQNLNIGSQAIIREHYDKLTILTSLWKTYLDSIQESQDSIQLLEQEIESITQNLKVANKEYQEILIHEENIKLNIEIKNLNHLIRHARMSGECPVCHNKNLSSIKLDLEKSDDRDWSEEFDDITQTKEQKQNQISNLNFTLESLKNNLHQQKMREQQKEIDIKSQLDFFKIGYDISKKSQTYLNLENRKSDFLKKLELLTDLENLTSEIKKNDIIREDLRNEYLNIKTEIHNNEKESLVFQNELENNAHLINEDLNVKNLSSDALAGYLTEYLKKTKTNLEHKEQTINLIKEIQHEKKHLSNINSYILQNEKEKEQLNQEYKSFQKSEIKLKESLNDITQNVFKIVPELNPELSHEKKEFKILKQEFELKIEKEQNQLIDLNKTLERLELDINTLETKIKDLKEKSDEIDLLLLQEEDILKTALKNVLNILPKDLIFCEESYKLMAGTSILKQRDSDDIIFQGLEHYFDNYLNPLYDEKICEEKNIHESIIKITSELSIFEEKKTLAQKWKEEIESKTSMLLRYDNLAMVLGGNEFRDFALTVIENELLKLANHELKSLYDGRYQLESKDSNTGQEFYINDGFRVGSKRKIATLSGGETFLVSLAMALGLSQMTSGGNEIESFFIDEGFGSLDHDSIADVINVLTDIRNRGKQICVISHVKALTDRLPLSLKLQKNHLGDGVMMP